MTGLKPYPEYKPSEIEWLREIPISWTVTPISRLSDSGRKSFVDGDWIESPYIQDSGVRLIQTGNVGVGVYREQGFRYVSDETFSDLNCTEVEPGDILICRLGDPVGRSCIAPDLGVKMLTSVDVCILKPGENEDARFINYAISSQNFLGWVSSLVRGSTRDRVSRSMLGKFQVPRPPLWQQRVIADYLDRETAEIDAFIADQNELIGLLNERRAATITQAVTKGLDPSVPMKDSGIEWLGEIPVSWTALALKRNTTFLTSGSRDWAGYYSDEGTPFIRIGNMTRGSLYLNMASTQHVTVPLGAEGERSRLRRGDVLFSITAYLGSVAIVGGAETGAFISQHVALVRPNSKSLDARFLGYCVLADWGQRQLNEQAYGGTKIQLSLRDIGRFQTTVPSIEEQQRIADYLDHETAEIDAAIADAKEAIKLSKERRAALISAAVTGKIDVRDHQLAKGTA